MRDIRIVETPGLGDRSYVAVGTGCDTAARASDNADSRPYCGSSAAAGSRCFSFGRRRAGCRGSA